MTNSFKRNIYFDVNKSLTKNNVTFLLGPRKCGKTFCMKQLQENHSNALYIDIKAGFSSESDKRDFINNVVEDIRKNKEIIYLIDEVTYLPSPDADISKIAETYSDSNNGKTKIVFAGSQSKSLDIWGHRAFAGNASFVKGDFLSYPEWLAFKGTNEISENTYADFVSHTREFYKDFVSTEEYLKGCLDETVISNRKAVEYITGNDYEDLDVDMLLDTLYASLVTLHDHTTYDTFADRSLLSKNIRRYYAKDLNIDDTELENRTVDFFSERYSRFRQMNGYDCQRALRFLRDCGLITLTYVTSKKDDVDPYFISKFLKDSSELYLKRDILKNINITINYPMFFVDIVSSVLGEKMPKTLPSKLIGSIVECHVRSLLPSSGAFEYRDEDGAEIDYVTTSGRALECATRNKDLSELHFNKLPDLVDKILLTKDRSGTYCGIKEIPYYEFIFNCSNGKDLLTCCSLNNYTNRNTSSQKDNKNHKEDEPAPDSTDDIDI